jgi:hypothetical protein
VPRTDEQVYDCGHTKHGLRRESDILDAVTLRWSTAILCAACVASINDNADDPREVYPAGTRATQTVEALIDKHGLVAVLDFVGDICREKQQHIQDNWQDIELAKRWNAAAIHVEHCSNIVEMLKI